MRGSREKRINIGEVQDVALLHLELQVDLLSISKWLDSKGRLVRHWPGNMEEVVRRGPRTVIRRSARRDESPFCLGEQ